MGIEGQEFKNHHRLLMCFDLKEGFPDQRFNLIFFLVKSF